MSKKLLGKLISNSNGRSKFIMTLSGLSVAILLITTALQLQSNYHELLFSKNNRDSVANFLVINKTLTDENIGASSLDNNQIKDLSRQDFIESVGKLTTSRFKAAIQSKSEHFPFYTDIAFETVPETFIDVNSKDWHWKMGDPIVPIIIPNQFLDFYNFQYSFSQHLPQLTPQVVKMVVFNVILQGAGHSATLNGKIVGMSNRISSMLVPESFMEWANKNFSDTIKMQSPSRVVIKTRDPGNPRLSKYLKDHGLSTDADRTRFSKYRQIVELVVNIAGITGLLLMAFAMMMFAMFIELTIASSKDEIGLLLLLGYTPSMLRKFLMRKLIPPNLLIVLIALLLTGIGQYCLSVWLSDQQIFITPWLSLYTVSGALLLMMVMVFLNNTSIKKYLKRSGFKNTVHKIDG